MHGMKSYPNDNTRSRTFQAVSTRPEAVKIAGVGLSLLLGIGAAGGAEILGDTAAFGFADFLTYRNVTSKGWNFGNSAANAPTVTLLGATMKGNLGVSDASSGLSFTTAPLTYAISGFAWSGAPEQAARDALSKGGLHGGAGFYTMKLAATPGSTYVIDILALDAFAAGGRSMDVLLDGVLVKDNWFVAVGSPYNRVLRLRTVADADGIDLRLDRGGIAGTDQNPAISAVALTQELASPPSIATQPCSQTQPVGGTAVFTITAGGSPTPTLQWRKNEVPIGGQTGSSLTLTNVSASDIAGYDVVVTNANGTITSSAATLAIAPLVIPSAITADLKGYWRFDETMGCTAADTSGQHRSGNLLNFPAASSTQWTAGRVGGALRFGGDATAQHVIVPAVPLPATPNYTLAAWVLADSRPVWGSIAKNWFGYMHLGLDAGGGQLSNYFGIAPSGQIRVAETELFPLDSWQHVVCTVDASTLKLYRNGNLTATQAWSGSMFSPLPAPMGIGVKLSGSSADTGGTAGYWHGLIDDMALWHRSLSAGEIATLYAAGVQGLSLDNPNPLPPASALVISEFLGDNSGGALDEDYDSSDWIELYNGTASSVNLDGYYLTDELGNKTKWRFPAVSLPAGGYQLVWASSKNRRVPGQPLHTNFQLSDGEELYLVAPDGTTIVHGYTTPLNVANYGVDRYPDETNVSFGIQGGPGLTGYFPTPTPGGVNAAKTSGAGPLINAINHAPEQPAPAEAITVSALIRPEVDEIDDGENTPNSIVSATLTYRVMFGPEQSVAMRNDGTNGDLIAGDNVWTGVIPSSHGAAAGQMLRWRISALSGFNTTRRAPQFLRPDAPEYFGTVIADTSLTTPLPVFHRFVETPALADTLGGTFCSIYYNGEFHDRCRIRLRGNTSRSFPKKSHKIDLPPGRRVPLKAPIPGQPAPDQVSELNLNTTYTDKSYTRALMAAEMHALSGIASPEIFHIHQRENGTFYSVALCVENVDDTFLKKHGIDDHGAFYKAVGDNGACDFTTASAFEKKNRHPEGYADLESVVTSLGLTGTALETWLFDNVDVPAWVNWHAGSVISQNIDASNKNYYIYRDTLGSREWSVLPWDLDLTFGPNALNTDTMVFNQSTPSTPQCTSHPLIGARPWQLHTNKYNRMIEAMAKTPRVREMVARRIRSLNDQFLATNWFGTRMDALETLLASDVNADHAKWGANSHFTWSGGTAYTLSQSISRIKTLYLAGRADYLTGTTGSNHGAAYSLNFTTGSGSLGVPAVQLAAPVVNFITVESNPASGNQDEEYLTLQNPGTTAVDLSAWTVTGGITFTFKGGTVIPAGGLLYLAADRYAFRQRATGPRGGQGLLVAGDYSGHLSNFGETLVLKNAEGTVISSVTTPPAPSDAQQWLRITEVNYNPPGTDESEFIELTNTSTSVTLNLAGIRFSEGLTGSEPSTGAPVFFVFPAGMTLAPGASTLVVRDSVAFQAAYHAVTSGLISGQFPAGTALDNAGETLKLDDVDGSTIDIVTWSDTAPWPAAADGSGASLHFIRGSGAIPNGADATRWFAWTANPGTTPDDADADGHSDLTEFRAGTRAGDGGSFLLPSFTTVDGTVTGSFQGVAGKTYRIQSSADLSTWIPVGADITPTTDGVQTFTDTPPAGARRYYRIELP